MSGEPQTGGGSVRPPAAVAFATTGFVALVIFGLGTTSLVLNEDVIATPGLGQVPGISGIVLTTAVFAGGLWVTVRRPQPSYVNALWIAVACFLAYLAGVWLGAVFTGTDLAVATAVVGRLATSWFGFVVAAAALVAAWGGIALVRTRSQRPRWPWEDEFDE